MPLTSFQKEVLEVIVSNRHEASHFAGGIVLNFTENSSRFSQDFDLFHDAVEDLTVASERDVSALRANGYEVVLIDSGASWSRPCTFRKARVHRGAESVELDWAYDSAFRFFPIVRDKQLGWRLHLFDMAVNKALALAGRSETRDYIDIIELTRSYPLEAILWAACGKDPGFSPLSLHQMVVRFARIDPAELDKIKARNLDPIAMKNEWIACHTKARSEIIRLADEHPDMPIGAAFIDKLGEPGWILADPSLKPHLASLRGCLPAVSPGE